MDINVFLPSAIYCGATWVCGFCRGNSMKSWVILRWSYAGCSWVRAIGSESEVAQWCPTLRVPRNCSLPGSSIHGIFQARILEWVAVSFSRRPSRPRGWTWVSSLFIGRRFTVWAAREVQTLKTLLSINSFRILFLRLTLSWKSQACLGLSLFGNWIKLSV